MTSLSDDTCSAIPDPMFCSQPGRRRRRVIGVDLNLLSALSASTLRSEQNGYLDSCTPSCVAEVVLLRGLVVQLAEGRSLLVRVRTW